MIGAFLRRDLATAMSYRLDFVWQVGALFYQAVLLFFLGRLLGEQVAVDGAFGAGYFLFALVGVAVADGMRAALRSFAQAMRIEQVVGTLEAMAATPVSLPRLILLSGCYPLLYGWLRTMLLLIAAWLIGPQIALASLLTAIPLVLLAYASFAALGVASAAMVVVLKQGEPVAAVLSALSFLFGGTLYPVSALPESVQWLSAALPVTYAIDGCRAVLLGGASLAAVWPSLLALVLFGVGCSAVAWVTLRMAVLIAGRNGVRNY